MTLSIVQASPFNITSTSNPLTLTLPAPPTANNRVVFVVSTSGSPWTSVPAGAVLDINGDDAGRFTSIYSRPVASGDGAAYTFTPSGTTGASRGVAYELTSTVGTPVLDKAAASAAASDVTRTVTLPAGTVAGHHMVIAAVGLGGASDGADAVSAPYATLAPTPIDAGRLHAASHTLTGTAFPNATFTWTTARRCIAVAAAYGETVAAAPAEHSTVMWTGTSFVKLQLQNPA